MSSIRTLSHKEIAAAAAIAPALLSRDILIFDGECRFCIAQSARLARLAGSGHVETLPLQTPGLLDSVHLSHDEAMSAMYLITREGGRFRGVAGVVEAMRHRPILGKLVRLYYLPIIKQISDLVYRLIARYRYAIMGRAVARGECESGSCSIHLHKQSH